MPLVSVIIPNYNHAPYLVQRIESILNQTYFDFELIILDDCSTDNSREVIEKYRPHPRVSKIIYNEQNSGSTFKQWQRGIEAASGDWIWIAESDDYCEPNFLEELFAGINKQKKCVMAFCATNIVSSTGEITSKVGHNFSSQTFNGREYVEKFLVNRNCIVNASMLIFKKEVYLKSDFSFSKLKFLGDWLLYINMALQGDIYYSDKFLNYFRKHDADVTGKAIAHGLYYSEFIAIINALLNFKIINEKESQLLLLDRLIMLKNDKRVKKLYKLEVLKKLRNKMNISTRIRMVIFNIFNLK